MAAVRKRKAKPVDLFFANNGSFVNICPRTAKGKRWAARNISGSQHGGCYPAESRFAMDIAEGAHAKGLVLGR